MKKYHINKDFDLVKFLTFPVIPQAAPIARGILKTLVNEHHGQIHKGKQKQNRN